MARPTMFAESAEPLRVTSPLFASTSIMALAVSLSAWSLPLIMVSIKSSSEAPVGAPTILSFVRTIVTPPFRSAWSSASLNRHSVMRVEISVAEVAATLSVLVVALVAAVAPVVLDELPVAPMVAVAPGWAGFAAVVLAATEVCSVVLCSVFAVVVLAAPVALNAPLVLVLDARSALAALRSLVDLDWVASFAARSSP